MVERQRFDEIGRVDDHRLIEAVEAHLHRPGLTPARSSTSFSLTPVQRAFPIAPLPHSPPATRGWKKPRELPEH
jgi:hypothetical protein